MVQEAWNNPVEGQNAMMILHNKLRHTATALRNWSRNVFGEARMQLHMVQKIIFRLDAWTKLRRNVISLKRKFAC